MKSNTKFQKKGILCSFIVLCFVSITNITYGQESAPVDKILKQTVAVLDEVERKTDLPKPKNVNITFETSVSTETGVGIKILIFKFGRKWQREQSNEITYKFVLTPNKTLVSEPIKEALTKAIKEAYDQLAKVNNDKAKIAGFTVKVSFIIEKSTITEGEYELVPITPSLGKSWKKKAVHTIEIEFE
jgi:hypothetical protein